MAIDYKHVDGGTDVDGKSWAVGIIGAHVVMQVSPMTTQLKFDGLRRDQFMIAFAQAEMNIEGYRRPCCDHCNNREGDPDGHDYVPGGSVHDGPCEQCAAEQARREHDAGTGD